MPVYSYKCQNKSCEAEFEGFYKMADSPAERECAECGSVMTRQIGGLIGGYAKGAGSYASDHMGKNATFGRYSKKVKK